MQLNSCSCEMKFDRSDEMSALDHCNRFRVSWRVNQHFGLIFESTGFEMLSHTDQT